MYVVVSNGSSSVGGFAASHSSQVVMWFVTAANSFLNPLPSDATPVLLMLTMIAAMCRFTTFNSKNWYFITLFTPSIYNVFHNI